LVVLVVIVSLIAAVAPDLLPASPRLDEDTRKVAALAICLAELASPVAYGNIGYRSRRSVAALTSEQEG
jgi:hypothetical protein